MNKYIPAKSVKLVFSGENYFETLEHIIENAEECIQFQTYIFEEDETGTKVAETLIRAAKRGIKVTMLVDGFGSNSLSKKFIRSLSFSGIDFRFFSPLLSSENHYLGRRLHHKIVVADKNVALVGGINIANKYRGNKNIPPWLDYAVLIEGNACLYLHELCDHLFRKKNFGKKKEQLLSNSVFTGDCLIRFRRNDWVRKKNEIHHSYREALLQAEKSVIIIASYFLPGFFFRRLLKRTQKQGIKITVILTGKSDVYFIRHAERYLYGFLLKNGIRILEWPNSMMHGKATIIDDNWATIGSYNINDLSHYRSIELNVDIKNKIFASAFRKHVEQIEEVCTEITPDNFFRSGFFSKIFNFIAFHYLRLIATIFFPRKFR